MTNLLSIQFLSWTPKCYSHALTFVKQHKKTCAFTKSILFSLQQHADNRRKQELSLCRCLSSTPEDFNKLISPANKDRVIRNLLSVKPVRSLPLKKDYRKAATLIPLCTVNGELSILYTLRSVHLQYGRGEISFPGGMMDDSDKSLTETALRETHEEIGLPTSSIDVWGSMLPLTDSQATRQITPVISYCGEIEPSSMQFNKNEVSLVFTRTIAQLCQSYLQGTTQFRTGYTLPIYLGKPQRIWGLTALTTHQFLSLLAPEYYKFKLQHQRPLLGTKAKK